MVRGGIGENTETCGKWMTEVCLGVFWMGAFYGLRGHARPAGGSRVSARRPTAASQMTKQSCPSAGLQPRNHHAAARSYGEWVRAVASLGLGFEAGLWNASMISVAPCSGAGA